MKRKKALSARSIEIDQLKSALAGEKNRSEAAEMEVKSILQEKARSEQDLRQMVGDITEKAKQQSHECMRLADELAAEKEQRSTAEQQCSTLAQETAKKEAAFAAERGTLLAHHEALQQKYDALTESFGAERQKSTTRESELARITTARDHIAREMQSLQDQLTRATTALDKERGLRAGAEKSAQDIAKTKDGEVQELNNNLCEFRNDLESARSALVQVQQERDAALDRQKSLSDDLAAAVLAGAQSDKLARSATSEMEQIREELETEQRLRHAVEEKLLEVTRTKERVEQNLGSTGEQVVALERDHQTKIQSLTDALDAEREARYRAEEALSRAAREKEQAEQKLQVISNERAAVDARCEDQITRLEGDLRTALERQRSLEEQLRDADREQAEKEAAMQVLNQEIEQAVAALAAEKEERHAAEEAYAEAKDALVALRKKPQIPSTAIEEVPIEKHAVVTKRPDLPVTILHGPQALTRKEIDYLAPVPPAPSDPETASIAGEQDESRVRIRSVEDLFEDPTDLDVHDLSDAIRVSGARPAGLTGRSGNPVQMIPPG